MLGYQFSLEFDNQVLEFKEIYTNDVENMSSENFGLTHLEKGIITTSWINQNHLKFEAGATFFSISFVANENGELKDLIEINSKRTKAEAYNPDMEILDIELINDVVNSNQKELSPNTTLNQNYPNPFSKQTAIGFDSKKAGKYEFTILGINGELIKSIEIQAIAGYNEIMIYRNEFQSAGLYFYQLNTPDGKTLTRKLVVE